jgi:hypothetical protein
VQAPQGRGEPQERERVLLELADGTERGSADDDNQCRARREPPVGAEPPDQREDWKCDKRREQRVFELDCRDDARLRGQTREERQRPRESSLQQEGQRKVGDSKPAMLEQRARLDQVVRPIDPRHERRAKQQIRAHRGPCERERGRR